MRLEADALLAVLEQLDGFTLCTVASTCKELRTAARDEVLCVQPVARVRARGRGLVRDGRLRSVLTRTRNRNRTFTRTRTLTPTPTCAVPSVCSPLSRMRPLARHRYP